MIIKASRIQASRGAGEQCSHVLRGTRNETISVIQGTEQEMHEAVRDASAHGCKYGLRHYKISPEQPMCVSDATRILYDLGQEFGFTPENALLVEHTKTRAGGLGFEKHYHALVREYDPVKGRVLDWHNSFYRHEKVARIAELRLDHAIVPSRHDNVVASWLSTDGHHAAAKRLAVTAALMTQKPDSAYTTNLHQMANRRRVDVPADKLAIKQAWQGSDTAKAFRAALAEQGIVVRAGDKSGVWIAERDGTLIGGIHRLVGSTKDETDKRLSGLLNEQKVDPIPLNNGRLDPPQADPPQGERQTSLDKNQKSASRTGVRLGGGASSASPAAASSQAADPGCHAETLEGPGEPPGPEAGPEEIARYRLKLALYEEKRGAQRAAQAKALLAANDKGGTNNGLVQLETPTQTEARQGDGSKNEAGPAIEWHHDRPSRDGTSDSRGDKGSAEHRADGSEHPRRDAAADRLGERSLAGGENPFGSDLHEAGRDGRQAFRHRIETARATAALGSLNIDELLDRLEPERVARKLIESERVRIARLRAEAPFSNPLARDVDHAARTIKSNLFAPMRRAQDALKDVLARLEAAPPVPWMTRFVPWRTAVEREQLEAREAVSKAHAAVTAASPSWDEVDNAVHLGRVRANNAARSHQAWESAEGQALDRSEQLLTSIDKAIQGGDVEMRRAVIVYGAHAAMRLEVERNALVKQEQRVPAEEADVVGLLF